MAPTSPYGAGDRGMRATAGAARVVRMTRASKRAAAPLHGAQPTATHLRRCGLQGLKCRDGGCSSSLDRHVHEAEPGLVHAPQELLPGRRAQACMGEHKRSTAREPASQTTAAAHTHACARTRDRAPARREAAHTQQQQKQQLTCCTVMLPSATGPCTFSRLWFRRLYVAYTSTGGMPRAADTAAQGCASPAGSVIGGGTPPAPAPPPHHMYACSVGRWGCHWGGGSEWLVNSTPGSTPSTHTHTHVAEERQHQVGAPKLGAV
jgi:hypothetical protein